MSVQVSRNEKIIILALLSLIFISLYAVYPYRSPGGFAYPSGGPFQMVIEENSAIDTKSTPGHDSILQLKIAHLISDGQLDKNNWKIALGYSILLIPFLSSIHAFLIPDLLLFIGCIYCTFLLATKFSQNKYIGYASVIALLFVTNFLYYFASPEKQHFNEFAFMVIAYWLFEDPPKVRRFKIITIGLIAGWVFWSNYVDIIYFIPLITIFVLHKPRKNIIWLFPCFVLIFGLFFLQYHIFGNPFYYGTEYQSNILDFYQKQTIPKIQNIDGENTMSFKPAILLKRSYCILIQPQDCKPILYGDPSIDEYNKSLIPPKRAILVGSTSFFIFAPYGFFRIISRYSGYEKKFMLSILACFITGIGFWISIFCWNAGGSPFWRYEMVWYPLICMFSVIGILDTYKRLSAIKRQNFR